MSYIENRPGWSRRRFLRAAGIIGASGALMPFIPKLDAEAAASPKRIIFISNGMGTDMTRWSCTGSETNFALSSLLSPLEPFKSQLLVLDGLDNEAAFHGAQRGHFGTGTLWTGMGAASGNLANVGVGWTKAPSVDRLIADRIGQGVNIDSMHLGTYDGINGEITPDFCFHYRAPQTPVFPEMSPRRAFDKLFEGATGTAAEAQRVRHERKSVLDLVNGELTRLRNEVPAADRERLEAHLDSIRKLEARLAETVSCDVPAAPKDYPESDINSRRLLNTFTRLHFDNIRLALACDLTRVVTFEWPHSGGSGRFMEDEGYQPFGTLHPEAHTMGYYDEVNGSPVTAEERVIARENMGNLTQWRAKMIANELLAKLPADVRDNTLLVWGSEMSEGGNHSNRNVPIVIFQGSQFGYFKAGRYLKWSSHYNFESKIADYTGGKSNTQLLVSLCHAMGLSDINSVGDPKLPAGPIEELV